MKYVFNQIAKLAKQNRGQSMTEFCVAGPILVLLLFSIIYVSDLYVAKTMTLVASRYGAWQLSGANMEFDEITKSIRKHFFSHLEPSEKRRLTITSNADANDSKNQDFLDDAVQDTQPPMSLIIPLIGNIVGGSANRYVMRVEYKPPLKLGSLDMSDCFPPDGFNIRSELYVAGNSWNGARTKVHGLIECLEEKIKEMIEKLTGD